MRHLVSTILGILGFFILLILILGAVYQNEPMERSVEVSFGKASETIEKEGVHFKSPIGVDVKKVSIANQSVRLETNVYSSDLQPVVITINIQFNIPEVSVREILLNYQGNVVERFIIPKVIEALKEVTATKTAENIIKQREDIRQKVIASSTAKLNGVVVLNDFIIENTDLSDSLEKAIESKMIQEQEAEKSKFLQEQAKIDAQTKIIRAQAEAKSAEILGKAISDNPKIIKMEMIKKWDGVLPKVVDEKTNILLDLSKE